MAGLDDIPGSDGPATRVFHAPAELGRGVVLVGRYEVERVLGEGGMGVVIAATDRVAGRRVALKFLLPDAARDEGVRARFQREAQAASALACDHVVRVFDVGTLESGSPFIAMELLEGEDLAAALERRGPLPVQEAVDHVLEALVAVGLAHLRGIAHRDLKPANLFLTRREDGRPLVKVLDFGLSKTSQGPENMSLTRTGHAAMGTPLYMAPEQIRSLKSASSASDVWAMGVIAFELTTGQVPFDGESLGALFATISADEPRRLEEVLPGAPPALGQAIARCLVKKPAERPSPLELAEWLVPLASERGREAFQRLQHDFVAAGVLASAAAVVDEASFAPASVHGTFAMTQGAPTTQLSVSNHMATPPPSVVPGTRSSSPAPARSSTGRAVVLAFVLAFGGAAGVMGWWLTRREAPADLTSAAAAPADESVAAPEATTPPPPASAAAPEIKPSAEAPPPSPEASAAPTAAPSTAASAAPAAAPRPPRPRAPPPPPPPTSKSIDDLIKKGRR